MPGHEQILSCRGCANKDEVVLQIYTKDFDKCPGVQLATVGGRGIGPAAVDKDHPIWDTSDGFGSILRGGFEMKK